MTLNQNNHKPIQTGDLVKLQVPPFSSGIAVSVIDFIDETQLVAVMINPHEYDRLVAASRIPAVTLREIEGFQRLVVQSTGTPYYGSYCHLVSSPAEIELFLDAHTSLTMTNPDDWRTPSLTRLDGNTYITTSPIAIINTHMHGRRIMRPIT